MIKLQWWASNFVLACGFRGRQVGGDQRVELIRFRDSQGLELAKHAGAVFAGYWRTAVALAGLAICETVTRGHAAASFDLAGSARMTVDAIHVLSATAWVGALPPFLLLVAMSRIPELRREAVVSMQRFSTLGHAAVALVLLNGATNTWLIVGRLSLHPNSPYQWKLLVKIAVALAMTCLAIANRYLIVPLNRNHPETSRNVLMVGAALEIALGLLAFALVASFGLEDPRHKKRRSLRE
ncbi:CopD family protein [Rhizobium leguminosarum]|uniref:CopD family protein n=1 Tax=Rhizobium leguminosarum TaxID=384 RepID=UPI0012BB875C|nr:CopD family protein [Rhizobium leguminosarum]